MTRAPCHMLPKSHYVKLQQKVPKGEQGQPRGRDTSTTDSRPGGFCSSPQPLWLFTCEMGQLLTWFRFKSVPNYQVAWFISESHMCSMFPRKPFERVAFFKFASHFTKRKSFHIWPLFREWTLYARPSAKFQGTDTNQTDAIATLMDWLTTGKEQT